MEKITFKNFPYKTTPLNDANLNQLQTNVENALNNKVDKVENKGLSTNDYTTSEKNKLAGIDLSNLHSHSNKTVIDKFTEVSGELKYDGNAIGGEVENLTSTKLTLGNWEIEEDSTTGNLKFSVVSE